MCLVACSTLTEAVTVTCLLRSEDLEVEFRKSSLFLHAESIVPCDVLAENIVLYSIVFY